MKNIDDTTKNHKTIPLPFFCLCEATQYETGKSVAIGSNANLRLATESLVVFRSIVIEMRGC